ncbi:diguanylate cyclase [Persephonella atlantica]|uniref:diguanylate cyclase n=1 Tax=Persephonella atlantica TaxID=2699429 RepID=A0ABS1GIS2_9AQUI|nr:sensor domain-containing diguanylate cyclase [Persephonella atlantica]MBK3332843.1 diguanylate cyclase [Persephonella atlantica]
MMNQWEYDKDYPVVFIDKDFNILSLNRRAVQEYGEVVGEKCYRVFNGYETPCDENSPYVCPIKVLQNSGLRNFTGVYIFNRKGKKYISLTVRKEGDIFCQEQVELDKDRPDIVDIKSVLSNLYEGIIVLDQRGKVKIINRKFLSIFRIRESADYFIEKDINEVKHLFPESIRDIFEREEFPENEELVVHYSDKYLIIKKVSINSCHKLWSFIEKKDVDLGDEIFRILLETTPVGIFLQCNGRFMYVNPTMSSILETTPGELIGTNVYRYIYPDDRPKVSEVVRRRKKGERFIERYTIRVVTGTGKIRWVEITSETIMFKGKYCGIGSVIDITDRKKLEENLRKLATVDQLTGIYNRYAFEKFLEEEINRAERYGSSFSIIMFDIDNFKDVNDMYGHQVGDRILKELVNIVRSSIRKSDIFARWGGEEFMILVPIKEKQDAYRIAEKIREKIEKHRFDNVGKITVSIGVSFYKKGDSIKTIIRRADTALYQAKKSGKNMTVVAD